MCVTSYSVPVVKGGGDSHRAFHIPPERSPCLELLLPYLVSFSCSTSRRSPLVSYG